MFALREREIKTFLLINPACVYLDLALGHSQRIRESSSLRTGQIFGLLEGFLQGENLLSGKSWSGVFLLSILVQHHVCLSWRKQDKVSQR